jgi:hypothetical protein
MCTGCAPGTLSGSGWSTTAVIPDLPISVVIDKKGTIHEIIQGILFPEVFEEKVKPLLR